MGLNRQEVMDALRAEGLHFRELEERDCLLLTFGDAPFYRNCDGEQQLAVVIDVGRDRVRLMAPRAWQIPKEANHAAVFETLLRLQWRYVAIRFEYDHTDGEIRPSVDVLEPTLPSPDAVPQLLYRFVSLVTQCHTAISDAITTGRVSESDPRDDLRELVEELSDLSPEQLHQLLAAVREGTAA